MHTNESNGGTSLRGQADHLQKGALHQLRLGIAKTNLATMDTEKKRRGGAYRNVEVLFCQEIGRRPSSTGPSLNKMIAQCVSGVPAPSGSPALGTSTGLSKGQIRAAPADAPTVHRASASGAELPRR